MRFGEEPVERAEGAILAHSLRFGRMMLRKGRVLERADLDRMAEAGVATVTVARLEPSDVGEDEAAARIAAALLGDAVTAGPAQTGRVNLHAAAPGVVMFDPVAIDRLNRVAEEVTLATIPAFAPAAAGDRIATVKIIPFAISRDVLADCLAAGAAARLEIRRFRSLSARLIQTMHEGLKPSVLEKTSAVTADRLNRIRGRLTGEARCAHATEALAASIADEMAAGADLLLVIGASAIVDRRDVIPSAIERLGGRVERLGMPVDPGNLILVGDIAGTPVLGLPGCARSPARNGLDWVLERIAAGVPVGQGDIARMGVGGLLIGRDEEKDYL
jgi:molybdenum cofactor cytidylyltransferase